MLRRISAHAPKNIAAIVALLMLALALALGGGASRADQLGQPIVRATAVIAVAIVIIARLPLLWDRVRPVLLLLAGAAIICLVQLVPLPPTLWHALGGRNDFATLSNELGFPEVWRPLSIVPDATINALFSLIVPAAFAIVIAALTTRQIRLLLPAMIAFAGMSAVIGLVQLGGEWSNPMLNETLGEAAGMFANRNHQALLLAIGLLLLPPWAMYQNWRMAWMRTVTAAVLMPFFVLMVLATGSRAGLVLAGIALLLSSWICSDVIGGFAVRSKATAAATMALVAGGIGTLAGLVWLSTRTRTLDRLFATDAMEDFRFRAFPTVRELVETYFPWGSGLGSFDTVFRAAEPLALLKPTYFNHAHNDFAEVSLEAGLPGILLLIGAIAWVASRAAAAQRSRDRRWSRQARTGVGIIVLVLVASAIDYPARVPIYMALLVIAASWLYREIVAPEPDRAVPRS